MTELFEHQRKFLEEIVLEKEPARACLYFKTGSGKSLTAVLGMKALGYQRVLVIAPLSTHTAWKVLGEKEDVAIEVMSHAKFRMKGTKVEQHMPVIADEFHMFGGHKGQGWRKLDKVAKGLKAPMFLLSATPNYNDAERVYCVQHILSPHVTKGGYLQFLYRNCVTEQNPFGLEPKVLGFQDYDSAADFLSDLPRVWYLEDDLDYTIVDVVYLEDIDPALEELNYDRRKHRMMASDIEKRHTVRYQGLVDKYGLIHDRIMSSLMDKVGGSGGTVMIYCNHATVAYALGNTLVARPGRRTRTPDWRSSSSGAAS
jgi:hypothetical protein